jgi:hypothetical protein
MVQIDHGAPDARIDQVVQHPINDGAATDFKQRFWPCLGQGTHAAAQTGGQDHCGIQHFHGLCDQNVHNRISTTIVRPERQRQQTLRAALAWLCNVFAAWPPIATWLSLAAGRVERP